MKMRIQLIIETESGVTTTAQVARTFKRIAAAIRLDPTRPVSRISAPLRSGARAYSPITH